MGLDVSGGRGGVTAGLEDLESAAHRLGVHAVTVGALGAQFLALGADAALDRAVVEALSRGASLEGMADVARVVSGVCRVEAAVLRAAGPLGAVGQGAALARLGAQVQAAVSAYRAADALAGRGLAALQDEVMGAVGASAPGLLVGLAAAGAVVGPGGLRSALDRLAYDRPWLVDLGAGGVDGLLAGLARDPACAVVLGAAAARAGILWPPRDEAGATAVLREVGAMAGRLEESDAWAGVAVARVATHPAAASAPDGAAGLMADALDLGAPGAPGRVRVTEVPQPDGTSAWILQLPGTQVWDPRPGANPFDLSTDVAAMSGEATLAAAGAAAALDAAMREAGRARSGDPVMLAGHSQGGILAAALASDRRFRATHRVTHLVTFGAPVARFPVPPSVRVLSVEHDQDPVPRLEGLANPDRPTWTTVGADLDDRGGVPRQATAAHAGDLYLATAREIDAAVATHASVSLDAWAAGAAPFLGAGHAAVVNDYRLARTRTPAPAPPAAGLGPADGDGGHWQNQPT